MIKRVTNYFLKKKAQENKMEVLPELEEMAVCIMEYTKTYTLRVSGAGFITTEIQNYGDTHPNKIDVLADAIVGGGPKFLDYTGNDFRVDEYAKYKNIIRIRTFQIFKQTLDHVEKTGITRFFNRRSKEEYFLDASILERSIKLGLQHFTDTIRARFELVLSNYQKILREEEKYGKQRG